MLASLGVIVTGLSGLLDLKDAEPSMENQSYLPLAAKSIKSVAMDRSEPERCPATRPHVCEPLFVLLRKHSLTSRPRADEFEACACSEYASSPAQWSWLSVMST